MSILMAALKQQQQTTAHSQDGARFYRKLALVLALLLALLTGAVAAYLIMPLIKNNAQPDVVTPAQPDAILAALKTIETRQAADAAQAKLAAGLTDVIAPATQPEQEEFNTLPAVKTLTAGTAEAEPRSVETKPVAAKPVEAKPVEAKRAEVSAELRDKFASALKATEQGGSTANGSRQQAAPAPDIKSLAPQIQRQIPPLRFEAHVYATTASQRWVKVNGKTLQEGQWVTADIRIREITAQYVLLEMGSELFSVPALSSWPD